MSKRRNTKEDPMPTATNPNHANAIVSRVAFLARAKEKLAKTVTLADGAVVRIQKLSQADVEQCRRAYANQDKAAEGYRFIVVQGVIDNDGKRVLEDADMRALGEMDFETVETIATAIMEFSGVTKKEAEKEPKPSAE